MSPGFNVLVVDDDRDILHAARLALSSIATVHTSQSLDAMGLKMEQDSFDAVLLDMNFAEHRDGREGLDGLARVQHLDASLSVVLMTAYAGVTLAVESLKRGAVDFVMKPWRNDRLAEAIHSAAALTQRRRHDEALPLDAVERLTIERALQRHQGNISLAAAALGLSRAALYRRKARYDL
jgi:two-component system, response regulator RegA